MPNPYLDIPATTAPTPSAPVSAPATTTNPYLDIPKTQVVDAPAAGGTGNSVFWDMFHPQAADLSRPQTWRDWATKTYYPTATDYGNAALDDVSMGTADYLQAGYGGGDLAAIRARTAASQAALGPMGPIVNAATYVAGPGKILGPLVAIGKGANVGVKAGRAALEGFGAGAISSEGHDLGSDKPFDQRAWDAAKQGTESAVAGVGGNWLGRGTAKVLQPAFDAAQGAPGRGGDPWFSKLREASVRGEDISPDVEWFQQQSGQDMSPVLNAQKIGTGPLTDLTRKGANYAGRVAASHVSPMSWISNKPGEIGEWAHDAVINRVRNYATQKAFDQVYPNVAGSPLHGDTSGWTQAIQQGLIGASLP
jgi:hypothetical protein